jgi:hypothetical protein
MIPFASSSLSPSAFMIPATISLSSTLAPLKLAFDRQGLDRLSSNEKMEFVRQNFTDVCLGF